MTGLIVDNFAGGGAVIYHGTPLTPRDALVNVLAGRAGCVSFYRPDDVEAVEAVCPQIMFRSRRIFVLDGGDASRSGVGSAEPQRLVARVLCLARTATILAGSLGNHPGQPRSSITNQRRSSERMAVRRSRRARLAHGHGRWSTPQIVRTVPSCVRRVDRRSEEGAGRLRALSSQNGRGCPRARQSLASASHAERDASGAGLSFRQRRQHESGTEWPSA